MLLERLWLNDFRNYSSAELVPAQDGLTVVTGRNGQGKSNLLEAIAYVATGRSFRGSPREALTRAGCQRAVVRAATVRAGRDVLVEAELTPGGRDRIQVNRQPLRRVGDLYEVFQVSVFSPDDLILVKGGPGERRRYLDEALTSLHPSVGRLCTDTEHVLRQRNALLKQAGGRTTPSISATLDVWDSQLARVGGELVAHRRALVDRLEPLVGNAYSRLAGCNDRPTLTYLPSWTGDLGTALASKRREDLRRGMTTLGPQRDDMEIVVISSAGDRLLARTHTSQGEQRSIALALRLAAHDLVVEETGETPVLLLDDVFSELDAARSAELIHLLPRGQAVLTTVGDLPAGAEPASVVRVEDGQVSAGADWARR